MGGRSRREGIYIFIYVWLIHFIVQQKLTQHYKATVPQLKKKKILPFEEKRKPVALVTVVAGLESRAWATTGWRSDWVL